MIAKIIPNSVDKSINTLAVVIYCAQDDQRHNACQDFKAKNMPRMLQNLRQARALPQPKARNTTRPSKACAKR
ncbi:hypothetical protein [Helicobacter canis]|uniref:hypothetical protein n=1 Tax=Helicobacter canis TaxID=29419 RepID=UPI0029432E15|nr:hypothetical protein [Helicobacter canis]